MLHTLSKEAKKQHLNANEMFLDNTETCAHMEKTFCLPRIHIKMEGMSNEKFSNKNVLKYN